MPLAQRDALEEVLEGWQDDLPPTWRGATAGTRLGFDAVEPALQLEPWEPIFPARRGKVFPGAPKGAHIFRAFDDVAPADVRCVILGQDPYPCPAFSTGRAFEAGNVAQWRELDKMFSVSVRVFIQLICAARTGEAGLAASFSEWPRLLAAIEGGRVALEPAAQLADRWVSQGVLLLNSSLTLSRFAVAIDPHQAHGHLPLWRPFILAVLRHLLARGAPLLCIGFGEVAADGLRLAGVPDSQAILRQHPARGDAVLALENPFVAGNRRLAAMGAAPIDW